MDHTHPQFKGMLGHMFGDHSQGITSPADAVLICGTYVFPEVFPELSGMFAPGVPVDPHRPRRPRDRQELPGRPSGLVADPKLTLAALADALEGMMDDGQQQAGRGAPGRGHGRGQGSRSSRRHAPRDRSFHDALPLHASLFAEELARQLPPDAIIFDEALTTSPELTRYLDAHACPGTYFLTRGGSLGVGIPGAIGIKLANPDKVGVRLHRRRREHVHDPGAVDGGPPRRRPPSSWSATTTATSC